MKKILSALLSVVMILSVFTTVPVTVFAADGNTTEFAGGSGTEEDPYLISTVDHLDNVRYYLDAHFKMISDIEFSESDFSIGEAYYNEGAGWEPIGYTSDKFTGSFDGNMHSISNLFINRNVENVGLFGTADENCEISNIVVLNANIVGSECVGGIVGHLINSSVSNCYVSGIVKGSSNVGGIVGKMDKASSVVSCISNGSVEGDECVGGICGYSYPYEYSATNIISNIDKCYNSSNVSGRTCVGGIVGKTYVSYAYKNKYVEGTYGGNSYWVTLWYARKDICISNCYNRGTVTGTSDNVAGIVGYACANSGSKNEHALNMTACYNSGSINSDGSEKGAIIGKNTTNIDLTDVYYLNGSVTDSTCNYGTAKTLSQMKSRGSFSSWDFDAVWTMNGDRNYKYPELQCFTLQGTVVLDGDIAFKDTVTPNVSGLKNAYSELTYEWYVNNKLVYTGLEYSVPAESVGQKIKVVAVSSHPMSLGVVESESKTVTKANQPNNPIVPELLSYDDKRIEISTVPTQEYSIDNSHWQSSGVFTNLAPNKSYIIYSRIIENDLYFVGKSVSVLTVVTNRRPLTGTVKITGTSRYGDKLTADVSSVGPDKNATYKYEWKRDGVTVGTAGTYTITKDDIGKSITLSVVGTVAYTGTLVSPAVNAIKANAQAPSVPVIESKTNNTVKLVAQTGYEYSKDKTNWQSSPLFEGLSPNVEYTFYQRIAETDVKYASKSSNGTKVTTLKNTIAAPSNPVIKSVTNNTVTLEKIANYEYSLDGLKWQSSNVFEGLLPNTEYAFCQRIVENETDYASVQSGYTNVVTLKNNVGAPVAPVIESSTDSSVTLVATEGYEYSKDGTTWQKSNVFTSLEPLETYTFYQRIAETDIDYASANSEGTTFKVKFIASKPSAPKLVELTSDKIIVETKEGYQYSIDGETWRKSGVFTGLNPNTSYSVYCRMPENDMYYESPKSNPLQVTTLKNTVDVPNAPVVLSKTDVTVTLVAIAGYEYSKNGVDWQESNVFTNLLPDTQYTFYQRVAETDTDYASATSTGVNATTYKVCEVHPEYHTYTSDCDTTCNECGYVREVPGHQYDNDCDAVCNVENCGYVREVGEHQYDNACDSSCNICGHIRTVGEHQYDDDCDAICNICGQIREVGEHQYDNDCDASCNICGQTRVVGEHQYDNPCDSVCNICGHIRKVAGHQYDNNCDTTCNICSGVRGVGDHVYTNSCDTTCNECGAVRKTTHTYTNSCDTTCNVCGNKRSITHTYSNACDTTCNVCSATRKVGAHKYTNSCDTTCNECGKKREIKHTYSNACDSKCNVCGATRSIKHSYKTTTTKATLSKNGSIVKKCTLCGKVGSNTTIKYPKTIALASTSYAYDGKVKTPGVTVKDSGGKTLKKNTDYTVSYSKGRKNVGKYSVVIKFKGNYSGSKTLYFYIKPTTKSKVNLLTGASTKIGAKSNTKISYASSDTKIAKVNKNGVITAVKAGTATITVKSNGISQKIQVTVKAPYVKVSGTNTMLLKKSVTLKATTNTGAKVKWSSSNTKVATVDSSGKVTGVGVGKATIYAKVTYKGKTYTGKTTVTVNKPYLTKTSATIDKGKTCQISVQGGSGTITYTSSDKSVATVSSSGVVKGLKKGTATITVKRNGYSMKFTVKVVGDSDKEILAAYTEFLLKNVALKNPSTYQVNNYMYKKNGSNYTVYVWYSAANGYGGMVDGWATAEFSTEKSYFGYSIEYGDKYIVVYTGSNRPSTFDGYIDYNDVQEEYDKIGAIDYYRPSK